MIKDTIKSHMALNIHIHMLRMNGNH